MSSSLADASFPSSAAFDAIALSLSPEPARTAAIKKGAAIFAFTLKNGAGATSSWYIDLKTTGSVGRGLAPDGQKPDVVMSLSDEDFQKLIDGKTAAQKLFIGGKLKVKGDVMKATKAEVVLKNAQKTKSKL